MSTNGYGRDTATWTRQGTFGLHDAPYVVLNQPGGFISTGFTRVGLFPPRLLRS